MNILSSRRTRVFLFLHHFSSVFGVKLLQKYLKKLHDLIVPPQKRKSEGFSTSNTKAAACNALDSFKHTYSALSKDVLDAIKPIYVDLSKDALLERCVGGFTQNNNETLNQLIWKISPKHLSGTSDVVEIAAYVAASVFNEGSFSLLTFMQDMGISSGPSAHDWAQSTDSISISQAEQKAEKQSKEGRIRRRQKQKDALDIMNDSNVLYGPGIDDSV